MKRMQHLADQLDDGILALRQELIELQAWPEAGDDYLALMPVSEWRSPATTDRDTEWMTQVIDDALEGKDIGAAYPSFFMKLLGDATLRHIFLSKLETARQS